MAHLADDGDTGAMTPGKDRLGKAEITKDAVQSTVEATAGTVGAVAGILTNAVKDVATAIGDLATEVFEIRDTARRAADDQLGEPQD